MKQINGRQLVTFGITDRQTFASFPSQARLSLKLGGEKGIVEIVDLGTVAHPRASASIRSSLLADPTCELRVVDTGAQKAKGLLLASVTLRLRGDGEAEAGRQGILDFLADDIAPQIWKLDIRPDDRPVVRIDRRVPQPAQWARTDPVFVAVALPVIVRDVFRAIFDDEDERDDGWMAVGVRWAGDLMPGTIVPGPDDDAPARAAWLDDLLDTFCTRHDVAAPS